LNDLLIICDQAENEYDQLKPKRPLDVIGITVNCDLHDSKDIKHKRFTSSTRKENIFDPEKAISVNVPCIQKLFKFYAR
jgi:hypothetical protein